VTSSDTGRTSSAAQAAVQPPRTDRAGARRRAGHSVVALLTVAGLTATGAYAGTATATVGAQADRSVSASAAPVRAESAQVNRTLRDPRIVESSGLARSRYVRGQLWTHNDSGGGPYLYHIATNGATVGRFRVAGAPARDWEAMASAKRRGTSYLFVGDIGDNASKRSSILVHRVREPRAGATSGTLTPKTYEFRYPDGAHNAETLMVKPKSMRIFIVTKTRQGPGGIYVAPKKPSRTHVNVLRKVGSAPTGMPDGVFLDRRSFVLRGYVNGWYYSRIGASPVLFRMPLKGESVTRGWNRHYVLVGAEGRNSQIWRVPLP
jgi:hypothetical protein